MGFMKKVFNNTRKPEGFLGKLMVRSMNSGHTNVSEWGLGTLPSEIKPRNIADLGCGGGMNIERLMKLFPEAELTGVDYSDVSVEMSRKRNQKAIDEGKCTVMQGDVSDLPLMDDYFDLVTAFETIYFWPGPEKSFREVCRILKDGGTFMIVNESDGLNDKDQKWVDIIEGMHIYSIEDLVDMLKKSGFSRVETRQMEKNHWLSLVATK